MTTNELYDKLRGFFPDGFSCTPYSDGWLIKVERGRTVPDQRPPADPLAAARLVVEAQAKDFGLWFVAQYATEAYLQAALRRLHAAIEGERLVGDVLAGEPGREAKP